MRIDSAQLQFHSSHQASSRYTREEQLHVSLPGRNGQMTELQYQHRQSIESQQVTTYSDLRHQAGAAALTQQAERLAPQVETSNRLAEQAASTSATAANEVDEQESFLELSPEDKLRIALIQSLLASLTGREINFSITDLRIPSSTGQTAELPAHPAQSPAALKPAPQASLDYQVSETFYQQESSHFSANGLVHTADGQQIQIELSFNISRELLLQHEFSMRLGAALHDPLVISFDGRAAELSQERFEFDLTLDGQKDWIPRLGNHSAFLALDQNGDGIINNGGELFGARTGNGFAELAEHDDDGNGWIDGNDAVFEHLRLWLKPGSSGSQQLVSLKEAGIGAIYLGHAETPFTLNNALGDERLGVIRSSGIYVSEQGKAGLIQHVDLSV